MLVYILLPYKEKFTKNKVSSVSITVSNNLRYSNYKDNVRIYGQYVKDPMYKENFNGIKNTFNFFKSKNTYLADQMCKDIVKSNTKNIVEVHNRPYLINKIRKKIKYINKLSLFLHNDPLEMRGSKKISERKELLLSLDKIYCVSKFVKDRFLTGLSGSFEKKVIVLYNGVIRSNKFFPTKKKEVIFVGRIVKDKGVHLFVEAISKIYDDYKEWTFSIIGSTRLGINDFDDFAQNIKNDFENIGNRTQMLGFVDTENLKKIMERASIIVIPSIWEEPFGLVAAEGMSKGIAIISSSKGGLKEVIGRNGILLNDLTSTNISLELKRLMSCKLTLEKFQKKSWNNFTLEAKKTSSILDRSRDNLFSEN